jgi:hypothetical protein
MSYIDLSNIHAHLPPAPFQHRSVLYRPADALIMELMEPVWGQGSITSHHPFKSPTLPTGPIDVAEADTEHLHANAGAPDSSATRYRVNYHTAESEASRTARASAWAEENGQTAPRKEDSAARACVVAGELTVSGDTAPRGSQAAWRREREAERAWRRGALPGALSVLTQIHRSTAYACAACDCFSYTWIFIYYLNNCRFYCICRYYMRRHTHTRTFT